MRKSILTLLSLMLFSIVIGCKSKSATNNKLDNKVERSIKGNWKISNVLFAASDYMKVTSFDLADSKCFIGSEWKLVSNNNKGTLSLNNASCTSYSTPITWFINKEGQFVMKILDEAKAKKVKSGYVLNIANVTEYSFQLIDKVNIAGKMTDVVYQFEKLN
jgi:curli biogenesis system outer membrane secretion channel CsgG